MRARFSLLLLLSACGVPITDDDEAQIDDAGPFPTVDPGRVEAGDAPDAGASFVDAGAVIEEPEPIAFKIFTMNLRTAVIERDTAETRTQMVADVIVEEQPDVVCVQEAVEMSSLENRAAALATLTGYEHRWEQTFGVDGLFDEGIALLSRWPIAWTEVAALPHPDLGGQNERKVIGAGITMMDADVNAFCSHMTTDPLASRKIDQASTILELIAAHPGVGAFAGDLNATPDEEAMLRFAQAGLVDSWRAAHPDVDGPTHPSDAPDRRIDYVWMIGGARVVECRHVLDAPHDGVWASDHIGVICTLELTAGAR